MSLAIQYPVVRRLKERRGKCRVFGWLGGWVVCETGNETCNRGCVPPPRRDTTRPHICGIDYYLGREHKWLSPPLLSTHAQRAGSNYTAASDLCLRRRRRTHTELVTHFWGCALKAPLPPPPPRLPDCRWIGVFACSTINGNLALCAGNVTLSRESRSLSLKLTADFCALKVLLPP